MQNIHVQHCSIQAHINFKTRSHEAIRDGIIPATMPQSSWQYCLNPEYHTSYQNSTCILVPATHLLGFICAPPTVATLLC